MNKVLGKLGGRKFVVTILHGVIIGICALCGVEISDERMLAIAGVAGTFILGQGIADGLSGGKTATTTPDE